MPSPSPDLNRLNRCYSCWHCSENRHAFSFLGVTPPRHGRLVWPSVRAIAPALCPFTAVSAEPLE
ncbi:MAG: hypothetical protein IGR76_17340 [Synechococcales cyanobacterium T60_A2020_003]|nr:hypothetical protein [Synechococcales cyanobacterium T60_A2020_003]